MTEIFSDCIITSLKFSMGSSGLLMVDISWVGTGLFTTASGASAPTFTSPTLSTGLPLSCTEALLRYSSTDFTELTSWDLTLDIGGVAPEVVGAVISPDVFTGQMTAAMNFTMLRSDYTKMTDFLAETTGTFQMCVQENETAPADFFSLFVPNIALGGVDKSPLSKEAGPRTQTISVPKELIGKDTTGGAFDATLVKLQVSSATSLTGGALVMIDHATRVRECADALKAAIADAVADGYRVDGVGNLDGIGVSETAKVKQPEPESAPRQPSSKSLPPNPTSRPASVASNPDICIGGRSAERGCAQQAGGEIGPARRPTDRGKIWIPMRRRLRPSKT
jgi:hypothetical protein